MRLFQKNEGPVTWPGAQHDGKDRVYDAENRVYLGGDPYWLVAVLSGPVPEGMIELDWEDDRAMRDNVIARLCEHKRLRRMYHTKRKVYDILCGPTPTEAPIWFAENVKAKARALLDAIADSTARVNMSEAFSLSLMTDAQEAAYLAWVKWAFAIQQRAHEIIAGMQDYADEAQYADDAQWPEAPAEAIALAKEFGCALLADPPPAPFPHPPGVLDKRYHIRNRAPTDKNGLPLDSAGYDIPPRDSSPGGPLRRPLWPGYSGDWRRP